MAFQMRKAASLDERGPFYCTEGDPVEPNSGEVCVFPGFQRQQGQCEVLRSPVAARQAAPGGAASGMGFPHTHSYLKRQ